MSRPPTTCTRWPPWPSPWPSGRYTVEKYAAQICKNAKALGQAMHELGFDVLCEHKGFTESHTIAVNVAPTVAATRRPS